MELLKLLCKTAIIYLNNIQIAGCSLSTRIHAPINRDKFTQVDNMITQTSEITKGSLLNTGRYLLITKNLLYSHVALIRSNSQKYLISIRRNRYQNILLLCDMIDDWIACICFKSCNGTLIRITRYIFEVNDVLDIAMSNENNRVVLDTLMIDIINCMGLAESAMSDFKDRESSITSIRNILVKIDHNVLESLKACLNMEETTKEVRRLIGTIEYILLAVSGIKLLIKNFYTSSYHLKGILYSTVTLFELYKVTIMRQFNASIIFYRISEIEYMQIYMYRTKQIHYIENISERIIHELDFFCVIVMHDSEIITKKIIYLAHLFDTICKCKTERCKNLAEEIIVLYNHAYILYEDILRYIKSNDPVQGVVSWISNFDSKIEKVFTTIYDKFGYTGHNVQEFFRGYHHDWKSLFNVPKESRNSSQVKIYCLLFSLFTIIEPNKMAQFAPPKFIFTTVLELNNMCYDVNETRVRDIILYFKNSLPKVFDIYLCLFVSFADSLHEVEDIFEKFDPALLHVLNTFFRTSIQKIYMYKLPVKDFKLQCSYYLYTVINNEFLDIFRAPIMGYNAFKELAMLLYRLVHFHSRHSCRIDKNYEIAYLFYKGLLELKLNYKTEFIENISLQFIVPAINYITYKNVRNKILTNNGSSKNPTKTKESECNNYHKQICAQYYCLSNTIINNRIMKGNTSDKLNQNILNFFYHYLTLEIDNEYQIIEIIFEGYYLIFSETPKFRELGELLLVTSKANIKTIVPTMYESNALAFIRKLGTTFTLENLQNIEITNTKVKKILIMMSYYNGENIR